MGRIRDQHFLEVRIRNLLVELEKILQWFSYAKMTENKNAVDTGIKFLEKEECMEDNKKRGKASKEEKRKTMSTNKRLQILVQTHV
jgi:hypothetical protein